MLRPGMDNRQGVPGLLSPEGFDMAWNEYMTMLLGKLNSLVAGARPLPPPCYSQLVAEDNVGVTQRLLSILLPS